MTTINSDQGKHDGGINAGDPERPVLLRFRGLRRSFGCKTVLNGVSGEIRRGDVILLRGDNGSGKTTLLNVLTGCLEPDAGSIHFCINGVEEHFHFPRKWWQKVNPWDHFTPERVGRYGVGRTWQDIRLFPSLDLADNIGAGSRDINDSAWSALFRPKATRMRAMIRRKNASETLASLGLSGRDNSSADRISLGQSKRVAIARALQAEAHILFLDEPLSGLDNNGVQDVLGFLRNITQECGATLIMVEHALNVSRVLNFASRIWTLAQGQLTLETPSTVAEEDKREGSGAIRDLIGNTLGPEIERTEITLPGDARLTTWWREGSRSCENPVLEVQDLSIRRGAQKLFASKDGSGLSVIIRDQTINLLEAPNGWGKTSLLDYLLGLLPAIRGRALLDGRELTRMSFPSRFFELGGRALKSDTRLFQSLCVDEVEQLASTRNELLQGASRCGTLSGGELRRVAVSTLIPGLLTVVDEFFRSLDAPQTRELLTELLGSKASRGILLLEPAAHLPERPIDLIDHGPRQPEHSP